MAEEDKSNSTDKLNSDESEMEPQTEAQRIVLKANQDQELRSNEMEIRELEKKMKQRQIVFISLLERNSSGEKVDYPMRKHRTCY